MIRQVVGDCRAVLPTLPERSVQCVVTSPPYWRLRDYGVAGQLGLEETPEAYLEQMVGVFREVRRVLRDDGTCWVNMGDAFSEKQLVGMPWRLAFALQADGWYLRADIIWAKPNPMPESVTDRPTKAHEYVFLLAKRKSYYYDAAAVREPSLTGDARRPYTSNGAKVLDGRAVWHGGERRDGEDFSGRNLRSVWTITPEPTPDAHFATFPQALVVPCILAGTRMGDTVLDPFSGTGTVGRVAEDLGRDSILIELSDAYARLADRKCAQYGLFASRDQA